MMPRLSTGGMVYLAVALFIATINVETGACAEQAMSITDRVQSRISQRMAHGGISQEQIVSQVRREVNNMSDEELQQVLRMIGGGMLKTHLPKSGEKNARLISSRTTKNRTPSIGNCSAKSPVSNDLNKRQEADRPTRTRPEARSIVVNYILNSM